jgi:hypothetical protein
MWRNPFALSLHPNNTTATWMGAGFLSNKTILILSPQSWGNMLLAKHHYAIELAKRGNTVYFLNPPDNDHWNLKSGRHRIRVHSSGIHPGLILIEQKLFFPYKLKFHSRALYNVLIKRQIQEIQECIGKIPDIIWSFDLGNLFPLTLFHKSIFKIFHPVDEPGDRNALKAAAGANILFSVTKEILGKYKDFPIPSFFINHGLAEEFIHGGENVRLREEPINVGISGNLLRPDLDRKILQQIIRENPQVSFHLFGSYSAGQSNIGAATGSSADSFIEALKTAKNVILHGVLKTGELAARLNKMDAFLISYDVQLDQSKGTNYHKVMEYLSTGKVIISNNITTYREFPELIRMIDERTSNERLPLLFRETLSNLEKWNSEQLRHRRKSFACDNMYQKQIDRIELHINGLADMDFQGLQSA